MIFTKSTRPGQEPIVTRIRDDDKLDQVLEAAWRHFGDPHAPPISQQDIDYLHAEVDRRRQLLAEEAKRRKPPKEK